MSHKFLAGKFFTRFHFVIKYTDLKNSSQMTTCLNSYWLYGGDFDIQISKEVLIKNCLSVCL